MYYYVVTISSLLRLCDSENVATVTCGPTTSIHDFSSQDDIYTVTRDSKVTPECLKMCAPRSERPLPTAEYVKYVTGCVGRSRSVSLRDSVASVFGKPLWVSQVKGNTGNNKFCSTTVVLETFWDTRSIGIVIVNRET